MFFWSFLRLLFPYFSWQQFSYLVSRAVETVSGEGGLAIPPDPQILSDQLTLFQSGGRFYHHIRFTDFPTALVSFSAVAKSQGKKLRFSLVLLKWREAYLIYNFSRVRPGHGAKVHQAVYKGAKNFMKSPLFELLYLTTNSQYVSQDWKMFCVSDSMLGWV